MPRVISKEGEERGILQVVKWELSSAASKMGEPWSDGGPSCIRGRPCVLLLSVHAEITIIHLLASTAANCSKYQREETGKITA